MPAENIPTGYQRWLLYWFKCPSCGHESSAAIGTVPVPYNLRTLYRFWCRNCGGYSVLKYPKRKGWVVLITLGVAGATFLALAPNWLACGIVVSFVLPLTWTALNRLTREYVPDRSL